MYSKQEASHLREEFWKTFGRYMAPVLSSEGNKVNWINYKTGEKYIRFKMNAPGTSASVSIDVIHPDGLLRNLYFEQFQQLKQLLHNTLGEEWMWIKDSIEDSQAPVCKIFISLPNISIFNKSEWPLLISFFKPRIIALDRFWGVAKYAFEHLK